MSIAKMLKSVVHTSLHTNINCVLHERFTSKTTITSSFTVKLIVP